MRVMLKSKIHRACVTDANIDYEGSITIDWELMEEANILPYEQVEVLNINNGARFSSYAIEGERGEICLNGATANLAIKGDIINILSYSYVKDDEVHHFTPKLVYVATGNSITECKRTAKTMTLLEAE